MTIPKKVKPLGIDDKYIHFLLNAGPGFGKTVLFGSEDKALFLTTDPEGTVSAWSLGSKAQEWEVKDADELDEAFRYLRDGGIEELGITWVFVDNISEVQEFFKLDHIQIERKRNDKIDEFVPSQANYQRTQNRLLSFVKAMNDLPVNVGYTAWIATHEDGEGREYFAPAIHGQAGAIAQMIAGYMNVVGYGEVIEDDQGVEHRRVWFSQTGPWRGKDRFVALGKSRTDLTMPKMQAIIGAAIKKRRAERAANTKAPATTVRRRTTSTPRRKTT